MNYSIPKPSPSISLYLLACAVIIGLCALFLAALNAFMQIMLPLQATFAAALIEIGMIVEAVAASRGKNKVAWLGLLTSLFVSGTYNYIQAQASGNGLNSLLLFALALGPLTSLSFLAMTLGKELSKYEAQVLSWQVSKQSWIDEQEKAALRRKDRQEARQLELQNRQLSGNFPKETAKQISDWRSISIEDRDLISKMTTEEIVATYPISDRTARNWKKWARENGYHQE